MPYIYKIINQINGKIYIGQTSLPTVQDRFNEHIKKAKAHVNRYLYDAMNYYGIENFIIEEIEQCDKENLDNREIYWIAYYRSNNKEFGYNMTPGGGGGDTWTSNPHKAEIIEKSKQTKMRNGTYGKAAPKGTTSPNKGNYKIKINKNDLLNDIKSFMSIEDICNKYDISRKNLYLRCNQYYGKTPTELRRDRLTHTNSSHISLNKDTLLQYIKENKTITEISQIFSVSKETVRRRIIEYFNKSIKELRDNVN